MQCDFINNPTYLKIFGLHLLYLCFTAVGATTSIFLCFLCRWGEWRKLLPIIFSYIHFLPLFSLTFENNTEVAGKLTLHFQLPLSYYSASFATEVADTHADSRIHLSHVMSAWRWFGLVFLECPENQMWWILDFLDGEKYNLSQ